VEDEFLTAGRTKSTAGYFVLCNLSGADYMWHSFEQLARKKVIKLQAKQGEGECTKKVLFARYSIVFLFYLPD